MNLHKDKFNVLQDVTIHSSQMERAVCANVSTKIQPCTRTYHTSAKQSETSLHARNTASGLLTATQKEKHRRKWAIIHYKVNQWIVDTYIYNFLEVIQHMHKVFVRIECDSCESNSSTIHSHIETTKFLFCSLQGLLDIVFTGNLQFNNTQPANLL